MDDKESHRNNIENCIRCGRCVNVCPMGLEPYMLMPLAENKEWERCGEEKILDCIECGSCSFTCPANRPLLDYIRLGKATVAKNNRNKK